MFRVGSFTLSPSRGRVDSAAGQAIGESVPFLAIAAPYFTRPILICQLELLALAALKPGFRAHGSRIERSGVQFVCCN